MMERQASREAGMAMVPSSNDRASMAPSVRQNSSPMSNFTTARRTAPPQSHQSMSPYEESHYAPSERGYDSPRGYDREPVRRERSPPRYSDVYDDEEPSDYYDRKERQVSNNRPSDPFSVFNSMFGGTDASNMLSGFGNGGGMNAMMGNAQRNNDPFAVFNDMFGNLGGGGQQKDPFGGMFDNLSLGGGDHRDEGPGRGAFATQRVTRRHVGRARTLAVKS
jgi:hypothetical protein